MAEFCAKDIVSIPGPYERKLKRAAELQPHGPSTDRKNRPSSRDLEGAQRTAEGRDSATEQLVSDRAALLEVRPVCSACKLLRKNRARILQLNFEACVWALELQKARHPKNGREIWRHGF